MSNDSGDRIVSLLRGIALLGLIGTFGIAFIIAKDRSREDYSYAVTNQNSVTAQWQYQQLRMTQCSWCGRTVNMNRHHVIPQAANPALRDVRENLVVLCRDCHFVLGHRCNWKQYNPDVLYICTHFTNCVKSADTRHGLDGQENVTKTGETGVTDHGDEQDVQDFLHVTNDVPGQQRTALERILTWKQPQSHTNTLPVLRNPGR